MSHPVGHDGARDVDALACQDAGLTIQGKAVAVFRDRDMSQQTRPRSTFLDGQLRRRCLENGLAATAGVFRPDMADDLQPGRDFFQHFGCRLANLGQAARVTAAALADNLWLMDHHFPRQMRWQRLTRRRFPSWAGLVIVCLARLRAGGDLLTDILLESIHPRKAAAGTADRPTTSGDL